MPTPSYILPGLYRRRTSTAGVGVFTKLFIAQETIIGVAAGGKIITSRMAQKRWRRGDDHTQQIHKDFHWAPVDHKGIDNLDLMNHSCDPNVAISGDMTFVALRDIAAGEELVWDYATSEIHPQYPKIQCNCGSYNCRTVVTNRDWTNVSLMQRYYPNFVTTHVRKKVAAMLLERHLAIIDGKLYFVDACDSGVRTYHEIEEIILEARTKRGQFVQIFKFKNFGIGLVIDGSPQCATSDSPLYRETFVHAVMLCMSKDDCSVAVYGGGESELALEILKYLNVTDLTIIDWDSELIEIAKQKLHEIHHDAWVNSRVKFETKFSDVFRYMKESTKLHDVIFVDLTDNSVADLLKPGFGKELKRRGKNNVKIIIQAGPSDNLEMIENLITGLIHLQPDFEYFYICRRYIPFFNYTETWIIATDDSDFNPLALSAQEIDNRIRERIGRELVAYSGAVHYSLFALPPTLKNAIWNVLGHKFLQFDYI